MEITNGLKWLEIGVAGGGGDEIKKRKKKNNA